MKMLGSVARGVKSLMTALALVAMLPVASQEKPGRYGKEDISFGKFYKAATSTTRRLLKDVFLLLFYRTHVTLVETWPLTVEDYCFDILGWSRKKYRDCFSADERKCLSVDVEQFEGDVSLLFKLLVKLYDSYNLPQSFFNELREIKNVRNRVCHDQLDFTEDMLQSSMEDLKQLIVKFLEEVNHVFRLDTSGLKQIYCDEIDDITAAPVTAEGISYFEKVEMFREDLVGKFITYGRTELFSYYSKLKILNPFTWLNDDKFSDLQVDKVFTPLDISNEDIAIELKSLLEAQSFEAKSNKGILPTVLILSGIAGSGKTSLCRYLIYDWRTRFGAINCLRSVDILILIEARNVTTKSLMTYLQRTLLKNTSSHFEERDILMTLQKLNVLYIVDGMDEASSDGQKLLEELFAVLGNSRVIITTRPEYSSSVSCAANNHHLTVLKLQIHGFSESGIAAFTSNVFSALETSEEIRHLQEAECLEFLLTTGRRLGDQLKIPLTVALLILLWRSDKTTRSKITSVTKLYSEIFKICTMKVLLRLQKATSVSTFDLEIFVEEWLLELGRMSYDMVKDNEYIISVNNRKFLTSLCKKHSVDSIQILSAFLICEVQESPDGVHYLISFIHKSQMEYLAGHYLANLMITNFSRMRKADNVNTVKVLERLRLTSKVNYSGYQNAVEIIKMRSVFIFAVGHLSMQKAVVQELLIEITEILVKKAIYEQNIYLFWRLVQESDCHPAVCKIVGDAISYKVSWKPDCEELCDDMNPTLQLLKYAHFVPKGITIRIVGSVTSIKVLSVKSKIQNKPLINLVPILQCVANKPEVKVVLRVDQHYYSWGDKETTDELLVALLPNGGLTTVMGHLGVSGARALGELKFVQELTARLSDIEALHAFRNSVAELSKRSGLKMVVRLDIPSTVSPTSFPVFTDHPPFGIVLKDIGDETAEWASEVLSRVSKNYTEVDLVASNLTYEGGKGFLKTLTENGVIINEKIIIRTFRCPSKEIFEDISRHIDCKLEWW